MRRVIDLGGPLVESPRGSDRGPVDSQSFLTEMFGNFERRLACPETKNKDDWRKWRRRLRDALKQSQSLDVLGAVPTPNPTVVESVACDGYLRQKIVYETIPGNRVPAYLLIPDSRGPHPAVICPHGHVPGAKENVVGLTEPVGVAYAHEVALRGCITLAPDNAFMGERDRRDERNGNPVSGCATGWARLNQMGLDLTGLRIFDLRAGLSLLRNHPDVDARRLGCAGLSGGCWLSQVLTALDRRVKAVILSGFFTTFVQTTWHGHCVCHHPFGIGRICDMPDISALIAPRAPFVESGISDKPYPHEPAYKMVKRAYELNGAPDRLQLHRYKGGHMFNGTKSIPWLVDQLTT